MRRAILFIAVGLILLGIAGWILFPGVRSDILERLPWIGGGELQKPVTLVYWGLWEPPEVIKPLLDEYHQNNPNVTIEYEVRTPEDHYQTVKNRLGGEGAPDIIRVHASWVPYLKDYLSPIPSDILSTQEYEQTFYPVNEYFLKYGDSYYGIPLMIEGLALVYNQDLFKEEGITDPPRNWTEFRELAARLTKTNSEGEVVQSGAALGYGSSIDYFADILGLMFAQNGVRFVDESGRVAFHQSLSPVGGNLGVEALSFYTLFAQKEPSWNPNWDNSTQEFANGRVAMVLLPSHRLHESLAQSPDVRVGVAPVPQLPVVSGTADSVGWANYWVEVVAKTSPNQKEAWRLLKWLSEKEQLTRFYRSASNVRSFGEPYPRVDLGTALNSDLYTLPYVQQGPSYTTWYFLSGSYFPDVNDRIVDILRVMIDTVAGGADAETELNRAAAEVQSILDQAQ